MHITEGVASLPVLIGGGFISATGVAIGLSRLTQKKIIATALLASSFFVTSLIHVPVAPAVSLHLLLNGLVGIILGWAAFPAIVVALLLSALVMQHGGITVLGVNGVVMGLPAVTVYLLFGNWLKIPGRKRKVASFAAGSVAVLLTAILLVLAMVLSDRTFLSMAPVILLFHLPNMIIEGVVTMYVVGFMEKVQPELLEQSV
ncbi:MAG: cobalt transporter CbiM [Desulfobulbaceae bacterium]|nr:cobalt transporter CbiM [Desulfobulbaceae bacterium]